MKRVCVITGLTATGKSKLAINIAKACDAIILSVDSVAVYRELPIASAAISQQEQLGIPHYGIGIASIKNSIDVAFFQNYALNVIEMAFKQNKNVIVVGGSGLYLNAILYDYKFAESSPTSDEYDNIDNEELYKQLCNRDHNLKKTIHVNNRQRILRALRLMDEVNVSKTEHLNQQLRQLRFDCKIIACDYEDRNVHRQVMDARVDAMISMGLKEEILAASKEASFDKPSMSAIGVKQWQDVFIGSVSDEACIRTIKTKTHQFAKRQRTWFKHQLPCEWCYVDKQSNVDAKTEECIRWLNHI